MYFFSMIVYFYKNHNNLFLHTLCGREYKGFQALSCGHLTPVTSLTPPSPVFELQCAATKGQEGASFNET